MLLSKGNLGSQRFAKGAKVLLVAAVGDALRVVVAKIGNAVLAEVTNARVAGGGVHDVVAVAPELLVAVDVVGAGDALSSVVALVTAAAGFEGNVAQLSGPTVRTCAVYPHGTLVRFVAVGVVHCVIADVVPSGQARGVVHARQSALGVR